MELYKRSRKDNTKQMVIFKKEMVARRGSGLYSYLYGEPFVPLSCLDTRAQKGYAYGKGDINGDYVQSSSSTGYMK